MKNKKLISISKLLKDDFYCEFKHEQLLCISESKENQAFAYLIIDETYPDHVLLSLAMDYPEARTAVNLALIINMYHPVISAEPFFVSQTGKMLWGDDAENQFAIEMQLPIEEIIFDEKVKH